MKDQGAGATAREVAGLNGADAHVKCELRRTGDDGGFAQGDGDAEHVAGIEVVVEHPGGAGDGNAAHRGGVGDIGDRDGQRLGGGVVVAVAGGHGDVVDVVGARILRQLKVRRCVKAHGTGGSVDAKARCIHAAQRISHTGVCVCGGVVDGGSAVFGVALGATGAGENRRRFVNSGCTRGYGRQVARRIGGIDPIAAVDQAVLGKGAWAVGRCQRCRIPQAGVSAGDAGQVCDRDTAVDQVGGPDFRAAHLHVPSQAAVGIELLHHHAAVGALVDARGPADGIGAGAAQRRDQDRRTATDCLTQHQRRMIGGAAIGIELLDPNSLGAVVNRSAALPGNHIGTGGAKRGHLAAAVLYERRGEADGTIELHHGVCGGAVGAELLHVDAGAAGAVLPLPGHDIGTGAAQGGDLRVGLPSGGRPGGLQHHFRVAGNGAVGVELLDKNTEVSSIIVRAHRGVLTAPDHHIRAGITHCHDLGLSVIPVVDRRVIEGNQGVVGDCAVGVELLHKNAGGTTIDTTQLAIPAGHIGAVAAYGRNLRHHIVRRVRLAAVTVPAHHGVTGGGAVGIELLKINFLVIR